VPSDEALSAWHSLRALNVNKNKNKNKNKNWNKNTVFEWYALDRAGAGLLGSS
jgi:hypothetical protein